jgi:ABC-2 type transport system permease protein
MRALGNALGLYRRYLWISLRAQLQYRASFLMQMLGHFLVTGVEFLGIWALFHRFGSLGGWRLEEVALFYGLVNTAYACTDFLSRGFDQAPQMVKTCEFDRLLLRPRSIVLQLIGYEFTLRRFGRLAQGLAVLVWAWTALHHPWGAGEVVILLAAIAGAAAMFLGLVILQATLAFWTTETLEVMNSLIYGGVEAAQYPLSIYERTFRRFFTFVVPLACVCYYPVLALLGRAGEGWRWYAACVSPMAGFVFLAMSLGAWRIGMRRYQSAGN